jgi:hypothetical protein
MIRLSQYLTSWNPGSRTVRHFLLPHSSPQVRIPTRYSPIHQHSSTFGRIPPYFSLFMHITAYLFTLLAVTQHSSAFLYISPYFFTRHLKQTTIFRERKRHCICFCNGFEIQSTRNADQTRVIQRIKAIWAQCSDRQTGRERLVLDHDHRRTIRIWS